MRRILTDVQRRGDAALRSYAANFDGLPPGAPLLVSRDEMKPAWNSTAPELQTAMRVAQKNIRSFAEAQRPKEWTIAPAPGVATGQLVRPLESVGCYVPGGRYPLPSTLLMTVTPAQVAAVARIVVCSPRPASETLAAAWLAARAPEFYRVGGAQAIAALAFGTASIPRQQDRRPRQPLRHRRKNPSRPGMRHQHARRPHRNRRHPRNRLPAGIAADLVAQAEHDPEALAVLITGNAALAEAVKSEVKAAVEENPSQNSPSPRMDSYL